MRMLLLLLAFALGFGAQGTRLEAATPLRPNILVIMADDLGRNDVGFMGGREIRTPHLDRLAAGGAVLDAFYVQPVCSPTRAAFLTGRYPMRHGLQVGVVRPFAQYGLPLEERTLAQALRDAGYQTAIVGKWHLGHFQPAYLPTRRGFDHQYGHYNGALDYFNHERDGGLDWHRDDQVCREEGYSTELIARESVRLIRNRDRAKPLFLYVPFNAVHAPHQVPDAYLEPGSALRGVRRTYAGMVSALDQAVGSILQAVEEESMRASTLILFSSDNGGPRPGVVTDNGRYRAGKGTLYEGGVRVAACAAWPGQIKPGTVITAPIHIVDLYPTLLKLAGASLEQETSIDGLDIWPTLTQGQPSPHAAILLNTTPNNGAVRVGDWKLLVLGGQDEDAAERAAEPDAERRRANQRSARIELYNLAEDPYETRNLAQEQPTKVKELRTALEAFAAQAVPPKAAPKAPGFQSPKVWGEP